MLLQDGEDEGGEDEGGEEVRVARGQEVRRARGDSSKTMCNPVSESPVPVLAVRLMAAALTAMSRSCASCSAPARYAASAAVPTPINQTKIAEPSHPLPSGALSSENKLTSHGERRGLGGRPDELLLLLGPRSEPTRPEVGVHSLSSRWPVESGR